MTQAPVVVGDVVYVLSDGDQTVYALDAGTGSEQWRFDAAGAQATIAVADGRLYAVVGEGEVYAIGDRDN